METNQAAEHLQVIRTLMERSALYRRALAPIMTFAGVTGTLAALAGGGLKIDSPRAFIGFWTGVATVALAGSFFLVRRQALKDSEPLWSPPTRRVSQAFVPPLVAGVFLGAVILFLAGSEDTPTARVLSMLWLPLAWVVLYGCALCAAGLFTPHGVRLFGWAFIIGGCGLFAVGIPDRVDRLYYAHGIMGFFFGLMQVAYGIYLYFTEPRGNAP